jgi:hypothetical protein
MFWCQAVEATLNPCALKGPSDRPPECPLQAPQIATETGTLSFIHRVLKILYSFQRELSGRAIGSGERAPECDQTPHRRRARKYLAGAF